MWGGGAYDTKAHTFPGEEAWVFARSPAPQCAPVSWVVAVAALAPSVAAANDGEHATRILYFEPLHALPAPAGNGEHKTGSSLQQLRFDAFGRRFDIALARTTGSWRASRSSRQLELYRGSIDGVAGSWVRLATKGDVLHGMMWDGTQLYAIEPASEVSDALAQAPADASQTIVFRLADVIMEPGAAACATEAAAATKASDAFDALALELKNAPVAMQAAGATRRLDVSALGDARFRERYDNEQDARDAILTRLNNVDGIFSSQLAIEIHVGTLSVPDASRRSAVLGHRAEYAAARAVEPAPEHAGAELAGRDPPVHRSRSRRQHDRHRLSRFAVRQAQCGRADRVAQHVAGLAGRRARDGPQLRRGSRRRLAGQLPEHALLRLPHGAGRERYRRFLGVQHHPHALGARSKRAASPICRLRTCALRASWARVRRQLGTTFQWQLQITNVGGLTARNARAELALPASLSILDASVVGGSCASGGGAVECELGDIAGGNVRTIELDLRSDVAGANAITAHVRADHESNRSDNDGAGSIVIDAPADVSVSLQGPASARTNQSFNVAFQVANAAADNAGTVTVEIDIPAGTTIGSASLASGSCITGADKIECTLAPLSAGATASGSISLMASADGSAALHAAVSGDYFDTNNANDTADLVVAVSSTAPAAAAQPAGSGGGGGGGGSFGFLLLLALAPLQRARRRLN